MKVSPIPNLKVDQVPGPCRNLVGGSDLSVAVSGYPFLLLNL